MNVNEQFVEYCERLIEVAKDYPVDEIVVDYDQWLTQPGFNEQICAKLLENKGHIVYVDNIASFLISISITKEPTQ